MDSNWKRMRLFWLPAAVVVLLQTAGSVLAGPRPALSAPRTGYLNQGYYWPQFNADQRSFRCPGSTGGFTNPDVFSRRSQRQFQSTGFSGNRYSRQGTFGSTIRSNLPAASRNASRYSFGRSGRYSRYERIITYSEYMAGRQGNRGVTLKPGK
ncbi:MAG TPA: hypothetical protein VJ417_08695 [Candidatus Glassbacteria bacterium]|nr:hypothetical protein [Candidatus Glassbacteria bacterium]